MNKATRERLIHMQPFRETMIRRILTVAVIALPIQFVFLIRAGAGSDVKAVVFCTLLPAVFILVAAWCLRRQKQQWRIPMATALLFAGIVMAVTFPQGVLARIGGYPQYGGMVVLTILLCGLLIGEFYVSAWTLVCCVSLQYAINSSRPLSLNLGWSAIYVAGGWLVIQFSRHLEMLHEASRLAEERQRSAIVAERTRFARDIHDTLAEGFNEIVTQLNAAEQQLQRDHEEDTRAHIEKAKQLASRSLADARRSVAALRSEEIK